MHHPFLKRVATVAGLALALSLPHAGLAATTDVSVHGTITEVRSHEPVAGSKIEISDQAGMLERITTDARGRYSAVGLSPGNITIVAATSGFMTDQITCAVEGGTSAVFDFALSRGNKNVTHIRGHCPLQTQTQDLYVR